VNVARETIYAALFDLLTGINGIKKFSRRLLHWSETNSADQPALFLVQGHQAPQQTGRGIPPKWILRAELYLYVNAGSDPNVIPAQQLNKLLDKIEAALRPSTGNDQMQNTQTLGGLVSHCWLDGEIEVFDGALGEQSVAIIPISILVP
jgi:hypothetical protein